MIWFFKNVFKDIFEINQFIDIWKTFVAVSMRSNINHFKSFYHFISYSSSSVTEAITLKSKLNSLHFDQEYYYSRLINKEENHDYLSLNDFICFIDYILFKNEDEVIAVSCEKKNWFDDCLLIEEVIQKLMIYLIFYDEIFEIFVLMLPWKVHYYCFTPLILLSENF